MTDSSQVERQNNVLHFGSMSNPFVVGNFVRTMFQGRQCEYKDFVLDFGSVLAAYPNVCVPIAGLLDFYRSQSLDFAVTRTPDFLHNASVLNPVRVSDSPTILAQRPLNTVWQYSSPEEVNSLVNAFLREVSRNVVCEAGVIQGLEWCLNEVLDNVLQHADTPSGFVMGQIHQASRHIAFCVFDHGQGIFNSLRTSPFAPRNALDAITMAIKEGVTRDKNVGQGNGMWGLHNIVRANSGLLGITSGKAYFRITHATAQPSTSENVYFLSYDNNCTTVDFQIDFDKPIAVSQALGGYEPVNLAIEELEDDVGNIVYPMSDRSTGTGTRRSGVAIRTELINLSRQSRKVVVLDFKGVAVVSSSFADELVGKLVAEVGFISFTQRFRLRNMNDFVEAITNRAVSQRLSAKSNGDASMSERSACTGACDRAGFKWTVITAVPVMLVVGIGSLIFTIIAAMKAKDGIDYRYPVNVRIIK